MNRRLNVPVPDLTRFSDLVDKRRPLGMAATRPKYRLLRETYFDTADGTLHEGGMTLCLRAEVRGHDVLELTIAEGVSLQGIVEGRTLETPVVGGGLYATLSRPSEIATRIRELVEPDSLRPRAALDIDRETRELRRTMWSRVTHRISFDEVIAHASGAVREFREITITDLSRGKTTLEELGSRLQADHEIVSDGLDTFQRIREALMANPAVPQSEVPHGVRVALMMIKDWEIALVDGPHGLTLPGTRGSGEDLAREFLGELEGAHTGEVLDLDLVGFATPRRGGSDLEIWLHEHGRAERPAEFVWIPLMDLMERLGSPRLSDPGLIAALLLLVRSEIGQRLYREAPRRQGRPCLIPIQERPSGARTGSLADDYLDLELSILDFNQRVLELAEDAEVPLLERFRFLSIFASNLDEFFVVRVARMKDELLRGRGGDDDDHSPGQLLDLVAVRVRALVARQYACLNQALIPALAERGVRILTWDDLDDGQRSTLSSHFATDIFPLLTPLTMTSGPGRSFPRLVSLDLALAVALRRGSEGKPELGYVPVHPDLDRYLRVPASRDYIAIEHVIGANVGELFPAATIENVYTFRASRLADVEIDEDSSGSLLKSMADEIESRPYKPIIRLEVDASMPREVRAYILKAIRDEQTADGATLTRADIYEAFGPIDVNGVAKLCDAEVEGGLYPSYSADELLDPDASIFDILTAGDVLCHHPFHDFEHTVGRFLSEAASDPAVVSIKLTLYRTGRRSPIMETLMRALDAGKDVSVFVELKARFDEASNLEWTHRLEAAGARVVYLVVGFKTHAKTALVIRREEQGLRRYVHVGTGNYNVDTARFYTDMGLLSADPDLGADLNDFFNELTGGAGPPQKKFRRLLVAPNSLAQGLHRMIEREIEHAGAGRPARIEAKINGLADRDIVDALYEASAKGVEIDLIVRSICTLRPGVPGLSDGIRVRSILGRYLEHSRIYYFKNAGQSEYYIGSADWRARNLRRRVEVVTPVDDPHARQVLRAVLDAQLSDPRAWNLRPDGVFERLQGDGPSSQQTFMDTHGGIDLLTR